MTDHDKGDKMDMRSDNGSDGQYGGVMWTNRPGGNPTTAVVDDDTLYLGATTMATERRTNGKIVAYDQSTGTIKWTNSSIGSVDEALAVVNGTVYIAADGVTWHDHPHVDSGKPGVFALDAGTGEIQWRNDATKMWGLIYVVGDRVYATSYDVNTNSDVVYVIDADTGTTITTYELISTENSTDETSYRVAEFTVVDETMYLAIEQSTETDTEDYVATYSYATSLLALDANNGDQLWKITIDAKPVGMAVSDNGVYLTAESDRLYRFSTDGSRSWAKHLDTDDQKDTPTNITAPSVGNGTVYVGIDDAEETNGQKRGTVHALEAATGAMQWRFETDAHINSMPVVDTNSVYVGAAHPNETSKQAKAVVYALNRSDGSERWSYATESAGYPDMSQWDAIDGMVPANGHLYLWTNTPHVEPQHYDYRVYALTESNHRPAPEHRVADDSAQTIVPDGTSGSDDTESESGGGSGDDSTETGDEQKTQTATQTTSQQPTTTTHTTHPSTTTATQSITTGSSTSAQTSTTRSTAASNPEKTASQSTTTTSGQPGFEFLPALGGLAGVGSYLLARKGNDDE
ncbi:PQQ-binding-like beta-propeller repeat protein [Haladaptatus salinisoli]|uniref:PQQ-binding-like beta-propeller repeat protein n=1 Tax=Haladaptatus salinisoli TaxID=2884876 RepID=UPI001D09D971|nr:PQQ-binding-like beta-propeller repeat protein [Haladaptatus salinisoli]